jgi:porphobilinogen synthase
MFVTRCELLSSFTQGWLDERKAVLETMMCFKRGGCDIILSYYAKQVAQWLWEDKVKELSQELDL